MHITRRCSSFFYQKSLKPLLFSRDAEEIHQLFTNVGKTLGKFGLGQAATSFLFSYKNKNLSKVVDGIVFQNPIGLSAGFDYNAELTQILPAVGFGFMTVGTITLEPYEGNAKPRLARFPRSKSLLVNKGFKSLGAPTIIAKLEKLHFEIPIGISIGSTNRSFPSLDAQIENILSCFQLFEASKVNHSYYELNVSCPNTQVGQPFADPENLRTLLTKLAKIRLSKPVYIKMPIDLGEAKTLELLHVADASFVCGVVFGNLTKDKKNPAVDYRDRIIWETKKGNLSGKPTFERSNALIKLTKEKFGSRFTIVGTGGVFSGEDAALKFKLGADLVQLITGMIYQGPQLIGDINEYLASQDED